MARFNRNFLISKTQSGVFLCTVSCRKGFLVGGKGKKGADLDHRRKFLLDLLAVHSEQMTVELLGFSVSTDKLQLVLRTRPDLTKSKSDKEVARRYLTAVKAKVGFGQEPGVPTAEEIDSLIKKKPLLKVARERIGSLSWFVGQLTEQVGRVCLKEAGGEGPFWVPRFRCLPLLDPETIAACLAQVETSAVRNGEASSAADSPFTSGALRWAKKSAGSKKKSACAQLIPIGNDNSSLKLTISAAEYATLVNWTTSTENSAKVTSAPKSIAAILKKLRLTEVSWRLLMQDFSGQFRRVAGTIESMQAFQKRLNLAGMHGFKLVKELFTPKE